MTTSIVPSSTLNQIDVRHLLNNNLSSNLVQKMSKLEYEDFFNKNKLKNYPDSVDYASQILPIQKSYATIPTQSGDFYTFNLPEKDFLTGMTLRITVDAGVSYSPFEVLGLVDRFVISQNGKAFFNCSSQYIYSVISELKEQPVVEFYESCMNGITNSDSTVTYFLPILMPLLKENSILLDMHKGLSVTCYYTDYGLSFTSYTPILEIYRTGMNQHVINSYIDKYYKPGKQLSFFHYNTFEERISGISNSTGVNTYTVDLKGDFAIKNLYIIMIRESNGAYENIYNYVIKQGNQIVDAGDVYTNDFKKINKINGQLPFNYDVNNLCIPFGQYDQQTFSGSLNSQKDTVSITLTYNGTSGEDTTLYVIGEYINTIYCSGSDGLFDSKKES